MIHTNFERQLVDEKEGEYHVTDMEGNVVKYKLYKGHKYPARLISDNVSKRLEDIAGMTCRDDDILLATYPKSGIHWLTNIVTMVVRGNTEYVGTPPMIDFIDLEPLKFMESPRIFGTHLAFECFPKGFKEGKSKIITISRNPKDMLASLYPFSQELLPEAAMYIGNWNGNFNFHMNKECPNDTWFDHVKMWGPARKQYPEKEILFLSFESMKRDLFANIVKISNFLGIERSGEFYKAVEERCTFSNMKRDVNKGRQPEKEWQTTAKGGILPIYRKGEIGDWKNWFTVAQSEDFDAMYEKELDGYDISEVYKPE